MTQVFLQWNCRGLISNLDDVNDLLDRQGTICFCLQETYLNAKISSPFRRHNIFRKDRVDAARASGGVAIVTPKAIPSIQVPLSTNLEAVAVQICLDRIITICSLYLPPSMVVDQRDFENLCDQLPSPFLILGDLNAHNPLWGGARADSRGKMLERVLLSRPLCLLNTGTPTHVNTITRSFSAIDISLCSPSVFHCIDWAVEQNPRGSDHYPVVVKFQSTINNLTMRPPRWKLKEANWSLYQKEANLQSLSFEDVSVEEANDLITSAITNAATLSIPQTSGRLPRRPKPWWTDDCEKTRKEQNRAWGVFRRYPSTTNMINFKKARAKARWTRRQAKRESWRNFVSSLNYNTPSKVVWDRLKKIKGEYTSLSLLKVSIRKIKCHIRKF